MRKLKIALINTFYPPYNFGGDGVYVQRLAHALARRGADVHILHDVETYKALSSKPFKEPTIVAEPPGVNVHQLRSPFGSLASLVTHQTGRALLHNARIDEFFQQEFDVTHFHNISLVGGPGILSKGSGVKLYTAHEHWLVCPTHILWRHNRELCDGRECLKCQLAYSRPPQLWRSTGLLERQAAHVDAFISLSKSSAENHKRFGFPYDMRVMPSFIPDEPEFEGPSPHPRPFALFVGRLEKLKGLHDVIPAFKEEGAPDLLVIGEGDYGAQLRGMAADCARIKFLGKMASNEIGAYYRHAAAVILPSVCYEVFPLVALEAFRSGTPIVARDLGPFPEIVQETGAGMLFASASEAAAMAARIAADAKLRADLGARARAAFAARWSEKAALSAYFGLIAELAAGKGRQEIVDAAAALVPK